MISASSDERKSLEYMHLCPDTVDEHPQSDLNSAVISLNVTVPARREASTLNPKGYSQLEWNNYTNFKRETIIGLDTKVKYKMFLKNEKKRSKTRKNTKWTVRVAAVWMRAPPLRSARSVSVYMCLCALQWRAPLLMILPGFFPPPGSGLALMIWITSMYNRKRRAPSS